MSVCENARWMRVSAVQAEESIGRLAECLLAEGISEKAFRLLQAAVFAVGDEAPWDAVRTTADGKVFLWGDGV